SIRTTDGKTASVTAVTASGVAEGKGDFFALAVVTVLLIQPLAVIPKIKTNRNRFILNTPLITCRSRGSIPPGSCPSTYNRGRIIWPEFFSATGDVAMGFAAGSISFTRFAIVGEHPKEIEQTILDKLGELTLETGEYGVPEDVEYGW